MRLVLRHVTVLPVVIYHLALHLVPTTASYHPAQTSTNIPSNILHPFYGLQDQDDTRKHLQDTHQGLDSTWEYPEDLRQDPDPIWQYLNNVHQDPGLAHKYFDSIREDPDLIREHLTLLRHDGNALRQYLSALLQDPSDTQQDDYAIHLLPETVQKLITSAQQYHKFSGQDYENAPMYPQTDRQDSDTQQDLKGVQGILSPQHPILASQKITSATQKYIDAHHGGDVMQRSSEGWSGAGDSRLSYIGNSCWDHLSHDNLWCAPHVIQRQVLSELPRLSLPTTHYHAHRPTMPTPTPPLPRPPRWLRRPPTKRYLGIELPDYIATTFSSIKTDNAHYLTKLHQLKQRMRNAGK